MTCVISLLTVWIALHSTIMPIILNHYGMHISQLPERSLPQSKSLRVLGAVGLTEVVGLKGKCHLFGCCSSYIDGHREPGNAAAGSSSRPFPLWVPNWRAAVCKEAVDSLDWYI